MRTKLPLDARRGRAVKSGWLSLDARRGRSVKSTPPRDVIPQAADDFKQIAQEQLAKLDGLIEGREFICGDRFTLADILLFAFLEFGAAVGQPLDAKCENLQAWYARVAARPSTAQG